MNAALFTKFVPHAVALGLEITAVELGQGRARIHLPWREDLIGDPVRGLVHGGVVTTLLDTLGGCCVFVLGGNVRPQATLDLRIDHLRPGVTKLDLHGEAECYRTTRHIAFVRGICHQGDPLRPIAHMTATFMIADQANLAAGPKV